jgi:energy-coupling factor transporter ATP-binding protein EcfA2
MRIKEIRLRQFKRFTDLVVSDIPSSARLVVLVGPNGSGKSSLFEAFNWHLCASKESYQNEPDYYVKTGSPVAQKIGWPEIGNRIEIDFHDAAAVKMHAFAPKKAFYIRSAYRNEADFTIEQLERQYDILQDPNRPAKLISDDRRVSSNYKRIVADTVGQVFNTDEDDNTTRKQIRERLIGEIRSALVRVFGDLTLQGPGNPLEHGCFFFEKGLAKNWTYKNLSGGEKAAFDLLLDFTVKRESFNETVYCIDEPELHMHSRLQGALLDELFSKLPERCQLWVATHSIGMIRKAKELATAKPGEVVFLDFDDRNFDGHVVIAPATTTRSFWKNTFAVAIGDLADLVAPHEVVCCEGAYARSGEFDAKCFRKIFEAEFPEVEFVSLGSASEVEKNSLLITSVLGTVLKGVKLTKVIDRDDRGTGEIQELEAKGIRVLSMRQIETYLFDDEILERLCARESKPEKMPDILIAKSTALTGSIAGGKPSDDFKSMSGELYNAIKRILELKQCGNNSESFCVQTLAPLVTPDTKIYRILKADIFG